MTLANVSWHRDPLARVSYERRPLLPWGAPPPQYHLLTVDTGEHRFLRRICDALGMRTVQLWVEASVSPADFNRVRADGLITALGECDGRTVAIAWSDFRVNAASFGRGNSRRFSAFLRYLRQLPDPTPLVYVVQSAGVSLMEGRTAFSDAFGLWPELLRLAEDHLVLTCATGKCLGLAPLLFGLGHYRVAVAGRTEVNLTGPEVIRLFFGEGFDFAQRAAAERCVERHDLVHEIVPSVDAALELFRALLAAGAPAAVPTTLDSLGERTAALLTAFLDGPPRELVPGWCSRVRLFVGTRHGRSLGLFVNPLERSNNLITVRTLEKYAAGLDLFDAMRLPIASLLDSPGLDPRFEQSDANNIRKILWVGEKIIRYPHGAMGVVTGRCFGGATTLAFPKVFGGWRAVALRGAQLGLMHERIVDRVLSGSARLLEQWREVAAGQAPGFGALLEEGSLDAVIDVTDLPAEIDEFLAQHPSPHPTRPFLTVSPERPRRSGARRALGQGGRTR